MRRTIDPFRLLLISVAGWLGQVTSLAGVGDGLHSWTAWVHRLGQGRVYILYS
jgi:hypothetical protein